MTATTPPRARWQLTPRTILIVGCLGFLLCCYPGLVPIESADDLNNARVNELTDWSSPVMAEVWRWLGWVISGPPSMLIAQTLLWLLGSYHLLARALPARLAAVAASLVLWFPVVAATAAVVCADTLLAGCLIAGAAAIVSPRRTVVALGVGLLVLASGMREGAEVAVLPIVVLGVTERVGGRTLRGFALGLAAWLAIAGAGAVLRAQLVDVPSGRRELALANKDIAGTLRFAGAINAPALTHQMRGTHLVTPLPPDLAEAARGWYAHPNGIMDGDRRLFEPPTSITGVHRIAAARDRVVRAHPGAYLGFRLRVLTRVLELAGQRPPILYKFTETRPLRYPIAYAAHRSLLQRAALPLAYTLDRTPLFRPYLYVALGLLLVVFAVRRRQRDAVMLLASGLGYELALMFVTATPSHRASHWMIGAVLLAGVRTAPIFGRRGSVVKREAKE